jgi:hypothetical protein
MNSKVMAYIGLFMGTVITALGLLLALKPNVTSIPQLQNNAVLIGGAFAIYGLFRLYRSYLQLRRENEKI